MVHDEHCDCNDPDCDCDDEEMTNEEMIDNNAFLVNAVIDMLIEKKVFTEDEFRKKLDSMMDEEDEEDEE